MTSPCLLAAGKSQREIALITRVDRKTIRTLVLRAAGGDSNSPKFATGSVIQIPPPRPPARSSPSACKPYRAVITEQLRLRRNYAAIYQELVDRFGFVAGYNSVKRFASTVVAKEPEQFDRLKFAPGEEVQVDYGEGTMTRLPSTDRYRRPRLFVMTMRYSWRSFRAWCGSRASRPGRGCTTRRGRYFGGRCAHVVLDNLKEGVIKSNLYEPELNHVYRDVQAHYGWAFATIFENVITLPMLLQIACFIDSFEGKFWHSMFKSCSQPPF